LFDPKNPANEFLDSDANKGLLELALISKPFEDDPTSLRRLEKSMGYTNPVFSGSTAP